MYRYCTVLCYVRYLHNYITYDLLCCSSEDNAAGLTEGNTAELQQHLVSNGNLPITRLVYAVPIKSNAHKIMPQKYYDGERERTCQSQEEDHVLQCYGSGIRCLFDYGIRDR